MKIEICAAVLFKKIPKNRQTFSRFRLKYLLKNYIELTRLIVEGGFYFYHVSCRYRIQEHRYLLVRDNDNSKLNPLF